MEYDYKNKAANVAATNRLMLTKTLAMFRWQGLPDSIPQLELEKMLQQSGYAFITNVDGVAYAFTGGLGGEPDAYGNPTEIIISNPYLKYNATLSLKDDGVLITNDPLRIGLLETFTKYNTMLVENDINLVVKGYNSRIQTLISASDDATRASANKYMERVVDGELSIIGENALFEGVRVQNGSGAANGAITQLIEYQQYLKASLYNEVGLDANYNMKRERLTSSEVSLNEDVLLPFTDLMYECRNDAAQRLSEYLDVPVEVGFNSSWALRREQTINELQERINELTDQLTEQRENDLQLQQDPLHGADNETSTTTSNDEPTDEPRSDTSNEPTDEPRSVTSDEPTDEPTNEQHTLELTADEVREVIANGKDFDPDELQQWHVLLGELESQANE